MAKQLMIYENVTPVSAQRHGDLCVESGIPYEFAKDLRAVPLVAQEIAVACREYTIVFAPSGKGDEVVPFVVLGVKENQNLYVNDEGDWNAQYIPAFIRRYPFVFAANEEANKFTLCIDETWKGCNREGKGERLFNEKGEKSEFLDRLLQFNENFQKNSILTNLLCKKLQELELLDTQQAQLQIKGGEKIQLTGFSLVNREKLTNLPADTLQELTKNGALELIYAHLLSLNNLGRVAGWLSEQSNDDAPSAPAQA